MSRWTMLVLTGVLIAKSLRATEAPTGLLAAYAQNREQGTGNFVTQDLILTGHTLVLEEAMTLAEQERCLPLLRQVLTGLAAHAAAVSDSPITAGNRRMLAVLQALLSGSAPGDAAAAEEWKRVQAGQGISSSEVVSQKLDYTQFQVRGKYSRSPEFGRYFQTMRYASGFLFPVRESAATRIDAATAGRLTGQAMQIAGWLKQDAPLGESYSRLLGYLEALFGAPDDLTLGDLTAVAELPAAQQRAALLQRAKQTGRQPLVLGGLVDVSRLEPGVTAEDALTGWRLLPSSRTADTAALQQLVFDRVGEFQGQGEPRSLGLIGGKRVKAFPLGLEVLALLGSVAAIQELDKTGERQYQNYADAFIRAGKILNTAGGASWLPALRALAASRESPTDQQKQIAAALVFWTRWRHATLLYAKQSYTPVAKGIVLDQGRSEAWLEPALPVYMALKEQVRLLAAPLGPAVTTPLAALLDECIAISRQERAGTPLNAKQIEFLNSLDQQFHKLAGRDDVPVVVDVHTNPSSQEVLQEGSGLPVADEYRPTKASQPLRGWRVRHHEFRQPMSQRLTDERWQSMLRDGKQP